MQFEDTAPTPLEMLIVEDSPAIWRELKRRIEAELGYVVHVAQTFAEARVKIESLGTRLHVATLDLALPDAMDGEVVDYARKRNIPSIVFTSQFDPQTRATILSKGVVDYVVKDGQAVDNLIHLLDRLQKNPNVRVLVVDDSSAARRHFVRILKLYNFQVEEAGDARGAMQALAQYPDISLMIVDYEMPVVDGVALTRRVRGRYDKDKLTIIGVSGADDNRLSVRFLKSGANDFLAKHCSREEFLCRVLHNVETREAMQTMAELSSLKDRFLSMAAHDLRNPIGGIKGFTSMLLEGMCGELSAEQRNILEFIQTASCQMIDLVNDLLDITVIESGRLDLDVVDVDLCELTAERMRLAGIPATAKGIEVRTDYRRCPVVHGDPKRLAQVVDNLVGNAIKFSPSGREVTVVVDATPSMALLCVRDQGPGIPHDEQCRLFKGFEKLSVRPTGGETSTGLGLAIVKKIVDAHKGKVWVESTTGQGSAFFVSLPLGG